IYLDGYRSPLGVLNANGDFTSGELEPGKRQLVFQKRDHEEKRLEREFPAGETVRLGTEVRLTPFGRLEFNVRPAEAQVTYQIAGQQPLRARNEEVVFVKAGRYTITARADKYLQQTETFEVSAGSGAAINIRLNPVAESTSGPPPPPPVIRGFDFLEGQLEKRTEGFLEVAANPSLFKGNRPGKLT